MTHREGKGASRFTGIRDDLSRFAPASIAATAAAFSLIPRNVHYHWRFGVLATLSLEDLGAPSLRLSASQAKSVVSGNIAKLAVQYEDPFEDVLAEEVAFHGGPYLVGAGGADDSVRLLRLVIPSFVLGAALEPKLRARLRAVCGAGLTLSDHVLRAAGLSRTSEVTGSHRDAVDFPNQAKLSRLTDIVAFGSDELCGLLGQSWRDWIAPISVDAGSYLDSPDEWVLNGDAERHCLVHANEEWIVARPYGFAISLVQHVLMQATLALGESGAADVFGAEVDRAVIKAIRRLGLDLENVASRSSAHPFSEFSAQIDVGVRLCCLVCSDSLLDLSEAPFGSWDTDSLEEALDRRASELSTETDDDVLLLVVIQTASRFATVGVRAEHPRVTDLSLTLTDLETLAFEERDNPLGLWKFAAASEALHHNIRVLSFSILDLYAVYRDHERSFATFREATMVVADPGSGAALRRNAKYARDLHPAPRPDRTLREIERFGDDLGSRLYRVSEIQEPRELNVVELGIPVWVGGPTGIELIAEASDLIGAVSYWIGEIEKVMPEWFTATNELFAMEFAVDVDDRAYWFGGGPYQAGRLSPGKTSVRGSVIEVECGSMIRTLIAEPTNESDRELVSLLIQGISQLREHVGLDAIEDDVRRRAVDGAAPLGFKKHMLAFPLAGNELLESADAEFRLIQEPDLSAVRFALGEFLMAKHELGVGLVPSSKRRDVTRSAVNFLLEHAQRLIDECQSEGIVTDLLALNEALVAQSEHDRAVLPTKAHIDPAAIATEVLRSKFARASQATICCRFLAEYAIARPPRGAARWSLRRYDRAMAYTAEMLDWAYLDDAFEYEMSDVDVLINDGHELRLQELDRYQVGRAKQFDRDVQGQKVDAEAIFMRRLVTKPSAPSPIFARLDEPMKRESGVGLSELGNLLHAAWQVAVEAEVDVVDLPTEVAIARLAGNLEWSNEKVAAGVSYLTLGERDNFLRPPDGTWRDVVPSRFSRRWSLNRRPFGANGGRLVWGRRQVLVVLRVMIGQMFSGRFQALANDELLVKELAAIASERGFEFEQEIAALVGEQAGYRAVLGVTAVNGTALTRPNGEDLGDIDVLAICDATQTLFAIECKDLALSLTPSEVASELADHFRDGAKTTVGKQSERVAWLKENLQNASVQFELAEPASGWTVEGVIVTSSPVAAPLITEVKFKLVATSELPGWLDSRSG